MKGQLRMDTMTKVRTSLVLVLEVFALHTSTSKVLDLHMLCSEVFHLYTCTDGMSYLNTSISDMLDLRALWKKMPTLHTSCLNMFYCNTSDDTVQFDHILDLVLLTLALQLQMTP